jgi:RNA polymerase sigma-70 factor (ECF subfamily)
VPSIHSSQAPTSRPGPSASFAIPSLPRAASRTVFLEDHPEKLDTPAGSTPEDNLIRLDNQAALHIALEQLPPQLREILLLCDVEEIKYKDIALILDVPIGTVMSRVSRARRTLRQLLHPQLGESI